MANFYLPTDTTQKGLYDHLDKTLDNFLQEDKSFFPLLANIASAIAYTLPDLNWAGFYLSKAFSPDSTQQLVLGPFWGKPAITKIEFGKGVVGTCAVKKEAIIVEDVHAFEGHIACDLFSNSEIVIPLIKNNNLIGILDIDSPLIARFNDYDKLRLTTLMHNLLAHLPAISPDALAEFFS